jgi:hypothetical protein
MVSRDWYRFFLNLLNKANQGGGGGTGTVTSVNVSGGSTGLTTSGGPVTTSGTITLAGTLDVDNGGTGATTASGARANLSAAILGTNNDITSMTGVTGGISSPDFIQFDTTATVTDATGRLYYDDEDQFQTLTFQMNGAAIQRVGEELYYRVKLSSAATKGQVLMFTGTLGASGGLTAAPATGLLPEQANYILGLAHESGITNDWVFVTTFGEVKQINTTGGAETWVQGDVLYYNPLVTGGLTKFKPTAPAAICSVAAVINVGAANGILFVRPTYGSVLGGTDGNVNFTSLASGNTLIYDAVAGVWENANLTDGTGINITEGAGSITITNSGVTSAIAGTGISVSGATGAVTITNTAPDQTVTLTDGTGISTSGTYPSFTITNTLPMTYPGAGIPNSTGTAWGTSYTTTGSGTVVALATSPSFTTPILGTPQSGDFSTGTFTWPTFNQNTTGTAANVTGVVAFANGGTGETTRQAAMDALAGAVTSGQYLRGNGTDVVMSAIQAADVPTLNQNTTGTAANVTGTVAISNGGTGQTSASAAFNALSPITSTGDLIIGNGVNSATRLPIGSNNFVLTSNGTTAVWAVASGSGATITNDTSTSTNVFPTFASATSGSLSTIFTSNAKYLYKPSTGELTSEHFIAGNGIYVNNLTIDVSYTIASGTSGMSSGPITVASGTTVTVASGSRWVVL